jgi:DNA-binding MarR family transcriptional regulator
MKLDKVIDGVMVARDYGLDSTDLILLGGAINNQKPTVLETITDKTYASKRTLHSRMQKLIGMGLLDRVADHNDKRVKILVKGPLFEEFAAKFD